MLLGLPVILEAWAVTFIVNTESSPSENLTFSKHELDLDTDLGGRPKIFSVAGFSFSS